THGWSRAASECAHVIRSQVGVSHDQAHGRKGNTKLFRKLLTERGANVLSDFDLSSESRDFSVFIDVKPGIERRGQVILTGTMGARFLGGGVTCRNVNQQASSELEKIATIELKTVRQPWDCGMLLQF